MTLSRDPCFARLRRTRDEEFRILLIGAPWLAPRFQWPEAFEGESGIRVATTRPAGAPIERLRCRSPVGPDGSWATGAARGPNHGRPCWIPECVVVLETL